MNKAELRTAEIVHHYFGTDWDSWGKNFHFTRVRSLTYGKLGGSPDMYGFAGRANQPEITCHVGSVYKVKLTNTYDVPLSINELIAFPRDMQRGRCR